MGYPTLKCPLDMWVYQELINEIKPDVIIETGTFHGGSALYMAMICDMLNNGEIITVDVVSRDPHPEHSRIKYLLGSSTSNKIIGQIENIIEDKKNIMVILDSEHKKEHVLQELNIYHKYIESGGYLIVEDTNVNGHPVRPNWGEGPMEALDAFLRSNDNFEIDLSREKFIMTQNPRGYLRRK